MGSMSSILCRPGQLSFIPFGNGFCVLAVLRRGIDRSPMEIAEDAEIAQAVQAAATKVLGHSAPIAGVAFWTDAAILSAAGIPSLLFGPAGTGAHAAEEWVDLASVEACAEIYLAAALDFCR